MSLEDGDNQITLFTDCVKTGLKWSCFAPGFNPVIS